MLASRNMNAVQTNMTLCCQSCCLLLSLAVYMPHIHAAVCHHDMYIHVSSQMRPFSMVAGVYSCCCIVQEGHKRSCMLPVSTARFSSCMEQSSAAILLLMKPPHRSGVILPPCISSSSSLSTLLGTIQVACPFTDCLFGLIRFVCHNVVSLHLHTCIE